ncbi:MAG: phosphodiesterase [Eggerthellaceae bacterium]
MIILIASDIHGSAAAAEKLAARIDEVDPDRIALLGDLLYHGPRNALPEGYDPQRTADILNRYADRIVAVKGNCEAEVDQWVLDFPCMAPYAQIATPARTLFLTHGHRLHLAPEDPPKLPAGTVFASGHTHAKVLEQRDSLVFLNPGSTSIPKDGTASYAVVDDDGARLCRLEDGTTLQELAL